MAVLKGSVVSPLTGAALRAARLMEASCALPVAYAVLEVPAGLLTARRAEFAARARAAGDAPVSFTTLVAYAVVRACADVPEANGGGARVHLGILVDVTRATGERMVRVPVVHDAGTAGFAAFAAAMRDVVSRARRFELTPADSLGGTISVTNPGGIGTTLSYARLMKGQAMLVGVGAIGYGAALAGTDREVLEQLGVQPVLTLTATYDVRAVSGARAAAFLGAVSARLTDETFYAGLAG